MKTKCIYYWLQLHKLIQVPIKNMFFSQLFATKRKLFPTVQRYKKREITCMAQVTLKNNLGSNYLCLTLFGKLYSITELLYQTRIPKSLLTTGTFHIIIDMYINSNHKG